MIDEYKYGMFKIDGKTHYDDIKILGTKVRFWECRSREINVGDIKDLLEMNPEIVIIGLGAGGLISVSDSVRDMLHSKKIKLHAENNPKACELYNQSLMDGKKVAAIFPGRG